MSLILNGDTGVSMVQSGVVEDGDLVNAPYKMVLGTAVASTSGTSIDFTGIPSWVKRITVMFNGVSTNGVSPYQIQLGISSGVETSGYNGSCGNIDNSSAINGAAMSTGFRLASATVATVVFNGSAVINKSSGNLWMHLAVLGRSDTAGSQFLSAGAKTLTGVLDRVRITTVNGTDTFDAGTINIMYEG